jgi:hypothetical protein
MVLFVLLCFNLSRFGTLGIEGREIIAPSGLVCALFYFFVFSLSPLGWQECALYLLITPLLFSNKLFPPTTHQVPTGEHPIQLFFLDNCRRLRHCPLSRAKSYGPYGRASILPVVFSTWLSAIFGRFFSFSDGCPTWSFHHVQAFSIGRGDKRDFFSHALFSVA